MIKKCQKWRNITKRLKLLCRKAKIVQTIRLNKKYLLYQRALGSLRKKENDLKPSSLESNLELQIKKCLFKAVSSSTLITSKSITS